MFWAAGGTGDRIVTRGTEWFRFTLGLISELDSFPYRQRGYSTLGAEHSAVHSTQRRGNPG